MPQERVQHTAIHCNIVQHTAAHYSMLQRTATHSGTLDLQMWLRVAIVGTDKSDDLDHFAKEASFLPEST